MLSVCSFKTKEGGLGFHRDLSGLKTKYVMGKFITSYLSYAYIFSLIRFVPLRLNMSNDSRKQHTGPFGNDTRNSAHFFVFLDITKCYINMQRFELQNIRAFLLEGSWLRRSSFRILFRVWHSFCYSHVKWDSDVASRTAVSGIWGFGLTSEPFWSRTMRGTDKVMI